eukprot:GSChrysophyteH1.ASY1.ANO1.1056.1 assembled CDS
MGKGKDSAPPKVGIDGKKWKLPPGIKGKDSASAQANKAEVVSDADTDKWAPMKPVVLDLSDKADVHYSEEENYRAYKLFNIIDTSGGGSITLRELKRCLMGDTFRTFSKKFDHPDTGFILGIDEDDCVVIKDIERGSPAAQDPFLSTGLQIWSINGQNIKPNDPNSIHDAYRIILSIFDGDITFEFVEPVIIITKFSYILDLQMGDEAHSIELPVGAVYNLEVFESKIRLAMRKSGKGLKHLHLSFDGKKRQCYIRSHSEQIRLLFQSGPNYQRSCKYALGFSSEDRDWDTSHRGQPMVFDLALGVKQHEAEIVLTELFEKFDADGSGEFEFEEFRDFYIRFLDTEESIQLLRDYAQYKFRDLEREAYFLEQRELQERKRQRHADLKAREAGRRKEQNDAYMMKSEMDVYGIRRRTYGGRRPDNLKMKRITAKKNRKKKNDPLANLTPAQRAEKRTEIRARRKEQDTERRLKLNEIFNQNAAINKQMRRDALQMMGANAAVHMIEVYLAIRRAVKTAVRTEETGVDGITQINVSLSHVIASPAFVVTAGMFTGEAEGQEIELKNVPPREMHPATQRYFLIRHSKLKGAAFDSETKHPAFFTADYERQPSRHTSFGLGCARFLERLLNPGKKYREENNIEAKWEHVPDWDTVYRPEPVRFEKPPKPLKSDRIVGRMTLNNIAVFDLPQVNTLLPNSPFVTISVGLHDDDEYFHKQRNEAIAKAKSRIARELPNKPKPEFRASTEVSAMAGEAAMWEDLGWVSRVRACDWLKAEVFVGSPRVNTHIGTAILPSMSWVEEPLDKNKNMELLLPILKDNIPTGQIRLTMIMDVGSEFDWFVQNYTIQQRKLAKERKFKKWLLRRTNAPKVVLPFPLKFRVVSIELIDLVPMHILTRNSPYVTVEFGGADHYQTDVAQGAGAHAIWPDLTFDCHLSHARNNLVFMVYSDMSILGRWNIMGLDLQEHPREKDADEIILHAVLTEPPPAPPGKQTGRLVVKLKVDLALARVVNPGDNLNAILGGEVPYGAGEDQSHASMSTVSFGTNYTPAPPIGILPARARLLYLAVSDLPLVGQGGNNTYIKMSCGRWSNSTTVQTSANGQFAEWEDFKENDWSFPVMERFNFAIRVFSGETCIGTFALTAKEFAETPRNGKNVAEVLEPLNDGAELVGKIKYNIYFDHEGDDDFVNHMFHDALNKEIVRDKEKMEKQKPIQGYGDGVIEPEKVDADGFKFIEKAPYKFDYLPHHPYASQPTAPPFRVAVSAIYAVDLKNMHTTSQNYPELNAACGQWAASAPPSAYGQAAGWAGLTWNFFMYSRGNLRIAVWSRQKLIGVATISPTEMLKSPVDKVGGRDLLTYMYDEDNSTEKTGKLKLRLNLESIHDDPPADKHAYLPLQIFIEPPILVTLYTCAVMELRNAHIFAKNSPFIKAHCGSYYKVSEPHTNAGTSSKWENMLWDIYMNDKESLKISVQSDRTVIGFVILRARYLCGLPIDKYGLTHVEMDLHDGGKTIGASGRIRLICRLEAEFREEEVSDEDELEDEKEARLNMTIRKNPKTGEETEVLIPKVTHVQVLGVTVRELRSMHTFTKNSPQVTLQCGDFAENTFPALYSGKSASWLDLSWLFYITQTSLVKVTIVSGSAKIGSVEITTQELYRIQPDDLGRIIIDKEILFEGETYGFCKLQLLLTDEANSLKKIADKENEDVDFKRFDHLADTGENMGSKPLTCPILCKISEIAVMDVAPIHAGVIKNSPYVQVSCGGFSRETNSKHRAGADALWEGDDCNWNFVIAEDKSILQVTVLSGWSRAGTLSVTCSDLRKMPRSRNGDLVLQGSMLKTIRKAALDEEYVVSVGRVRITMNVSPYVSEEEQAILDAEELRVIHEKYAVSRVLASMDILKIEVRNCVQVYSLFPNSPQVIVTFGSYSHSTLCAFDAGANAVWNNLNWQDVPIRDKSIFSAQVVSGNESLGALKMSTRELLRMIPVAAGQRDQKGNLIMEISGQIIDGDYAKGEMGIICRISNDQIQAVAELQMVLGSGGSLAGVESAITGTTATGRLNAHIEAKRTPLPPTGKMKYDYNAQDANYNYTTSITQYSKAGFIPDGRASGFVGTELSVDNRTFDGSTIADNDIGGSVVHDPDLMHSPSGSTLDGAFLGGALEGGHSTISNVTGFVPEKDLGEYSAMTAPDSQSLQSQDPSHPDFHVSKDPSVTAIIEKNVDQVVGSPVDSSRSPVASARSQSAPLENSIAERNDTTGKTGDDEGIACEGAEANTTVTVMESKKETEALENDKAEETDNFDTSALPITFNSSMSQSMSQIIASADDKDSVMSEETAPLDPDDVDDDHMGHDSLQSLVGQNSMLSKSTPTPVATRVHIASITASSLKNVHTFRKNSPMVTLECGDFHTKTKAVEKGGQECTWNELGFVFVMKRETFMRFTVYSHSAIIGSVAVSTREVLGIPKRNGKTIFKRNIHHDGLATGKLKIVLTCDSRESIGISETLNQAAMKIQSKYKSESLTGTMSAAAKRNPPKQSLVHEAVRKKLLKPSDLPLTATVQSISCIDVIPVHYIAPNSPYVQMSMGPSMRPTWKKRTKHSFGGGANASWTELDWSFDIFDQNASIQLSVLSGDTKAGTLRITVKELLTIPRSAQGYTEISGKIWTDDKLIAGQVIVTLLLKPYLSDEMKEQTKKRIEMEYALEGKTPRLLCYLSIDVITASEMTQVYKLLSVSAAMNKWKGKKVTESTKNKKGNIVWGDLGNNGWEPTCVYERSPLILEVEGGNQVIGSVEFKPEVIMAQPVDEEGHMVIFADLMDGEVVVGKLSIGATVSHQLDTRKFTKRVSGKQIPIDPKMIHAPDVAETIAPSVLTNPTFTEESDVASLTVLESIQEVSMQKEIREPRWSEQVRIRMLAVDGIRNMHTISRNSPEVHLECGDWKDASNPILNAGQTATWNNLHFTSFRMKKKGPCSVLKIEVKSKSYSAGTAELPCALALESARDRFNCTTFEIQLVYHGKPSGKVIFEFEFLPDWKPEPEPEPESISEPVVPGAKFDLNKTVGTYVSTGSHLPVESDVTDHMDLMDPTEMTEESPKKPQSPAKVDLSQLQLALPKSPDTGGLIVPYNESVAESSVTGSVSIATGLTNQTPEKIENQISNRPKTSRSADDQLSARPKSSRQAPPDSGRSIGGKTPISGASTSRTWATNASPDSEVRSESEYNPDGDTRGTTRSTYSGNSWLDSRESSARSDYSDSQYRSSSDGESEYSQSSRSDYTDASFSSRSGSSYYSDGSYLSTGRSSEWSRSSRSGYSSRYSSARSARSSARTDPITGGRTSRDDPDDIIEEGSESDYDNDENKQNKPSKLPKEQQLDPMQMKGGAAAIAAQLAALGYGDKTTSSKGTSKSTSKATTPMMSSRKDIPIGGFAAANQVLVEGEHSFDITGLHFYHQSSSEAEVTKAFTREFVRGSIHKAVMQAVVEETGGDFSAANFKTLACTEPRYIGYTEKNINYDDLVTDFATVITKSAVATGGKFALNRILGVYTGEPGSFGAGKLIPYPAGFTSASEFIASARTDTTGSTDDDDDGDEFVPVVRKMGTEMGRRAGVILTSGLYGDQTNNARKQEEAKKEKEIDLNDLVFGKVRGHFDAPILRGIFKIHDLLGFDVSFLDARCVPRRPYLTACKPYGDWAAEAGQLWTSNRGLKKKDMHCSYYDLCGQWAWPDCNLRLGQMIIFDFHDGGSGLIFMKLRVNYEMLEACKADENEMLTCYCEAQIAQEYGGGSTAGVLRCSVDLDVNFWKRPLKTPEYWEEHRVHHWKTFPLIPISQGTVKQAHRYTSKQYDQQRVVHPAFYGFRIRWRGHDHDESKFINPIFMGFQFDRKPASKRMAEEAEKLNAMRSSANPWHYDVMAAQLGKCPVCGDGVAGCPRCFMMPTMPGGEPLGPDDFAYDPIKEAAMAAAARAREEERNAVMLAREANRKKLLESGKALDDLDADSDNEEDAVLAKYRQEELDDINKVHELHTKLTTYSAVHLWRTVKQKQMTVFVKILPGAYIRKLTMYPEDMACNIYHYFCSHSDVGLSDSKMILLPTSTGIFEIHEEIQVADEFSNKHDPGRVPLSRYGLNERGATVTLLFMPRYMQQYTVSLLASFYERNSAFRVKSIPSYSYVDDKLPKNVPMDPVQTALCKICINLYNIQQLDYKNQYIELGEWFRVKHKADIEERIRQAKVRRAAEAEEAAKKRRLESQLRGYEGEEREAKLQALLEMEKTKKGNVSEADTALAAEAKEKFANRMEMVKRKRERYRARMRGEHFDEEEEEEEEMNEDDKKADSSQKQTLEKADASGEVAEEKGAATATATATATASSADDDDFLYDEYSDDSNESDYESEDSWGSAVDGPLSSDEDEEEGDPEVAHESKHAAPDSARSAAESVLETERLSTGRADGHESTFEAMDEAEVLELTKKGSKASSRANSARISEKSGASQKADEEPQYLQDEQGNLVLDEDGNPIPVSRPTTTGSEFDLTLPLGDAESTTNELIDQKRVRDGIKLKRAQKALRKAEAREEFMKENPKHKGDFPAELLDDVYSDEMSDYSTSTGTYTSRTGWSVADDWGGPPSLAPSTPPVSLPPPTPRPVLDENGDPIPLFDASGTPLKDEEGNIMYKMEELDVPTDTAEGDAEDLPITGRSRKSSRRSSRRSSKGSRPSKGSIKIEVEYDEDGNPILPLSPRPSSSRTTASTASSTTIYSTSTESTVFSAEGIVPRLNMRPGTGSSGYSSYTDRSYTDTDGSYSSRSSYTDGSYTGRSAYSRSSGGWGTLSDPSRPSTGSSYTESSYYSARSGSSYYSDGTYGESNGSTPRFSFGAPRGGGADEDDYSESDYSSRYTNSSYSGRTDYTGSSYTNSSGSWSSRTGSTFTDFSDSRPSTGRSDTSSISNASYATFATHKTTAPNSEASSAASTARSSDYSDYSSSTARSDATTESEKKKQQTRAAGGGYGKGSRKPDHRLIYKQMYGSSKGPKPEKNKTMGPGERNASTPRSQGSGLSARMSASMTEAADELISKGAEKDMKSKSQATNEDNKSKEKEKEKGKETSKKDESAREKKEPEPEPEEIVRVPPKRPAITGNLAPLSPREGAIRVKDRYGRGEDEIYTDPSPLAMAIAAKEAEAAMVLSRPTTGKVKKSRK